MSETERFWSKVDETEGGCWIWMAGRSSTGYGVFSVGGRAGGMVGAHRWSLENIGKRDLVGGLPVDHLCRNRACVNPDHLEQVTTTENNRRAAPYRDIEVFRESMHARRRPDFETHCIHGHPRSPEDYVDKRGTRHCRTCKRERDLRGGAA